MELFNDILEPRRQEKSNFLWVSRKLNTVVAFQQTVRPKPDIHKKQVLQSEYIQEIINKISQETQTSKTELQHTVKLILDEIGFNKQLKIIRWLGLVLTKICQKIYSNIYVNEASIARLKAVMGNCPVIFAPSHRSYADFILMSYVCFTYDLEIPAIAAGMDFHAMWGMGTVLRDTGAFFMRRSYNDDYLYWETFKQYIHQIVTKGDLPIEFFIEGTRSRSCKSLVPKFGLLSMMLKPFFTGEVPDIIVVPINISYDRVLEEKLFTFELLGVPKPKESTSGFFKSLSIIKEHYGSIHVDFTTPISLKEYFGDKVNKSFSHNLGPIHNQQLSQDDKMLITDLGYKILRTQRSHCTLTPFNLTAMALSTSKPGSLSSLASETTWLKEILEHFGARVTLGSLNEILQVHGGLVTVGEDETKLELVSSPVMLDEVDPKKLKGYRLSNETMTRVVPYIMLQLYVNPCLHYLADACLITVALLSFEKMGRLSRDELFGHFRFLRAMFSFEFVFFDKREEMEFDTAINKLLDLNVIEITNNGDVCSGNNEKVQLLFVNLIFPFVSAYSFVSIVLNNMPTSAIVSHTHILSETQKHLEEAIQANEYLHSYALNLDTLGMCIQKYVEMGVLLKIKQNEKVLYSSTKIMLDVMSDKLDHIFSLCAKLTREPSTEFAHRFASKL